MPAAQRWFPMAGSELEAFERSKVAFEAHYNTGAEGTFVGSQ